MKYNDKSMNDKKINNKIYFRLDIKLCTVYTNILRE